jgi:TNF receptor-associated protein 1
MLLARRLVQPRGGAPALTLGVAARRGASQRVASRSPLVTRALSTTTDNATPEAEPEPAAPPPPSEAATGSADRMEFQAETKKLLDIVAKSLYTDKEVFVR